MRHDSEQEAVRAPSSRATADLVDEHAGVIQSCDVQLRSFGAVASFSGSIRTVRCFEDIALLRSTLQRDGEGQVLVVDAGGSVHKAVLGDMIGKIAEGNGWAGVVLNGAVRDTAALRTLQLGVKAVGSNPLKGDQTGAGELDVPVSFGGVTFAPGDQLFADEDGVVVLPAGTVG